MRVVVRKALLRGTLKWAERLFAAAAILLLGYCGFVWVDAWAFQQRQSRALEQLLDTHQGPGGASVQLRPVRSTAGPPAIAARGLIGRIEIPRLELSAIIVEGDDSKTLRRAVGHIHRHAAAGTSGEYRFHRTPRYVFPALEEDPLERHYCRHDIARRVSLPRRVHQGSRSERCRGVGPQRQRGPYPGHLLSVLLRWRRP